jgi:hypothetical protein
MSLLRIWEMKPEQLFKFGRRLLDTPLYMSDEHRTVEYIVALFSGWLSGSTINELYEIGDFGGVLGFINIIPGWKCGLLLKLWERKLWGATLAREGKKLVDDVMGRYRLRRISNETGDMASLKLYRMFGWELEGVKQDDFMWNGKLYNSYINAYLRDAVEDYDELGKRPGSNDAISDAGSGPDLQKPDGLHGAEDGAGGECLSRPA